MLVCKSAKPSPSPGLAVLLISLQILSRLLPRLLNKVYGYRSTTFPSSCQGLYGDIFDWWLRFFEKKQFKVFLLDDYKNDPLQIESAALSHLNLIENLVQR